MPKPLIAYLGTLLTMLVLDAAWLGWVMGPMYKAELGPLLLEQPRWAAAGLFYLLFVAGVVVFCVMPSVHEDSLLKAVGLGALFGLVAYGTYDLTNLATLSAWTNRLVVFDLPWGMFITAAAAAAGVQAIRWWGH